MYNYFVSSPLKRCLHTAPDSSLIFVFLGWKHAFHVTWKNNILSRLSKLWWFCQALHNLQKKILWEGGSSLPCLALTFCSLCFTSDDGNVEVFEGCTYYFFVFKGLCVASRNEIDPRSFSLQTDSKDIGDFLQLGTRVQHFCVVASTYCVLGY